MSKKSMVMDMYMEPVQLVDMTGSSAAQAANGKPAGNGASLGFETKPWATADALRNNMDASECKHVVLGLIFLKYISDAFEAKHAEL